MPYYEEVFLNRTQPQSYRARPRPGSTSSTNQTRNYLAVMDSVKMTSYRSRPHRNAVGPTKIVEDIVADPYANFLRSTSERQYREALEARGLVAHGEPDRGHPFELSRHTVMARQLNAGRLDSYDQHWVEGGIPYLVPNWTSSIANDVFRGGMTPGDPIPYQETGLPAFAQSAYARSAPTSVIFDAGVFLGELLEGLPRLIPDLLTKGDYDFFRSIGSDYLNAQFGWIPFVKSIQDAATALGRATAQLAQQGERVHRKYAIPPVLTTGYHDATNVTSNVSLGSVNGHLTRQMKEDLDFPDAGSSMLYGAPYTGGRIHKMRKVERWFEGEFSSFYKLGFDPTDYFSRLDQLVKFDITPETLWELAPWSWLVDWNLRIGDSIAANQIAANDRIIMHYGYAMERTTYRSLHSLTHAKNVVGSVQYTGYPANADVSIQTEYKRRIRANPYGFRVTTPSAFSAGQLAILGALGLTKL